MKRAAKNQQSESTWQGNGRSAGAEEWTHKSVRELPRFPCRSFTELKAAVEKKQFSVGVDPLAAAQWAAEFGPKAKKSFVASLSILLILAAIASVVVALAFENYWLLLALPIQAVVFYLSHSNTSLSLWVSVAGSISLLVFFDLLLNHLPTAATLVAYAGLTFASVRAANSITNNSFRKALIYDEELFVEAFVNRACTLRNVKTKEVFEHEPTEEA